MLVVDRTPGAKRIMITAATGGAMELYADLSALSRKYAGIDAALNNLCVDEHGRAYVGELPAWVEHYEGLSELLQRTAKATGEGRRLIRVDPDAGDGVASSHVGGGGPELLVPSGMAVTADGKQLLVAETHGAKISAYARDSATGALSGRKDWAPLPGCFPDGLCLDAEGCVWVAVPFSLPDNPFLGKLSWLWKYLSNSRSAAIGAFLRVAEGGELRQVIRPKEGFTAMACVLVRPKRIDRRCCCRHCCGPSCAAADPPAADPQPIFTLLPGRRRRPHALLRRGPQRRRALPGGQRRDGGAARGSGDGDAGVGATLCRGLLLESQ